MTYKFSKNVKNPLELNERIVYGTDGNLELTGHGYIQVPAGTDAQRPDVPEPGMMRYNTTSGAYEGYSGGSWGALASTSAATAEFVNFFYDGGTAPVATEPSTGYLGQTRGSMVTIDTTTQPSTFVGPTDVVGNPTLTYLNFDIASGYFSGFLTGGVYYISTSFDMKHDSANPGAGTIANMVYHAIDVRSGSDNLVSTTSAYPVLADVCYGGASYTPWEMSVNMSTIAKFTSANPADNKFRISLDGNQSQYYYSTYGYISVYRLG